MEIIMIRERVWETVKHNQTDSVPYNVELTGEELEKTAEYIGINKGGF